VKVVPSQVIEWLEEFVLQELEPLQERMNG
jgi:hypothetical protein